MDNNTISWHSEQIGRESKLKVLTLAVRILVTTGSFIRVRFRTSKEFILIIYYSKLLAHFNYRFSDMSGGDEL